MKSITARLRSLIRSIRSRASTSWKWYRSRAGWLQALIAVVIVGLLIGLIALARGGSATDDAPQGRTVTVASVSSLSGNGSGTSILGSVRSVTEADLLAQTGGTVKRVNTSIGATVGAGAIIAELDNASEAAVVLQAEGAYDSAIAARNIVGVQSGSAQTSLAEAETAARTVYRTAFTAIDTTIQNDVDTFFGDPTPTGPHLLINQGNVPGDLSRDRDALDDRITVWRMNLATASTRDPEALLDQATRDTQAVSDFLLKLSQAANARDSRATPDQIAALARARSTVNAQLAALSGARDALNAKQTSAQVAGTAQSSNSTQIAGANASVKSALGALRGAQANLEKTRIRATIGGTINFLDIHVGDYVTAFKHVATVAQNGALEIVSYVSEDARENLAVGMNVSIEGGYTGIVTSIAPALDPNTKQIEVHIAVSGKTTLVNGQSVRISLPSANPDTDIAALTMASSTTSASALLPLAAVKLLPDSRIVFTVDENNRLVAHKVTIGDVVGDRIEITSGLSPDLMIVTDARGLSEGEKITVATSTPQ